MQWSQHGCHPMQPTVSSKNHANELTTRVRVEHVLVTLLSLLLTGTYLANFS